MILTKHAGFVWGCDGDEIIIQLRQGGKLRCKNPGTFDTGDRVVVIPNTSNNEVIQVLSLKDAEHAVRSGIDPIYAAYSREPEELPLDEEEVLDDIECRENDDVYGII